MQVFRGLFFVERKFIFWECKFIFLGSANLFFESANQADGTSFFEINEAIHETIHEH